AGRHEELRRALPDLSRLPAPVRHYLEVDLANPYLPASRATDHGRWEAMLSDGFTQAGLERVKVAAPGAGTPDPGHLFNRLGAERPGGGTDTGGPLVTVIMPCYRPDDGLMTSIASISAQTWEELEILVVDDASGQDYEDVFDRAVASDPRARLVRMERNGGSYLARNAALRQARGDLVTFQDADDWSHPRRIEHQARLLLDEPDAPASRSLAVRAKDDLTHQWFGYRALRDNASSLMVRREVFDRIGLFAPIRKGADSEYAERITTLAGPVLDTGTPLAITRLRTGTLSRGDFTYQWSTPDRLVFKGSYRAWHKGLVKAQEPALGDRDTGQTATTLAADPTPPLMADQTMPFAVPRSFLRGLDHAPGWDELGVAYLGDFSAERSGSESPTVTAEADGRVGLWHQEAVPPVRTKRPEMHPSWFEEIARSDGRLVPLSRLDEVKVQRLVVLDPRVLVLAAAQPCRVRVTELEIELTPEVLQSDSSRLPVDLLAASDTCQAWWGVRPRWVPAHGLDEASRREVYELVPDLASSPTPSTTGTR
ncbi:MAG TPA: glycosyltransferase family A protein, partial [Ornithinicoccus sp.]|nr:glycosyltransferase family A protein [Ornithinicoccus sp.]